MDKKDNITIYEYVETINRVTDLGNAINFRKEILKATLTTIFLLEKILEKLNEKTTTTNDQHL